MARSKKLFSVLQKIIFRSQVLGTYPYNELIQTQNIIWTVYQAILFISNNVIAFCVTRIHYDSETKQFFFSIFVSCTRFVISAIPTVNFVALLMKRHLMKEIFETMIEVDTRLEMLGFHPRYILDRRATYFSSSFTILCIISFALAVDNDLSSFSDIFHLAVALCTTSAAVQLVTDLVSIAGQQFQLMNTSISKSFCNQSRIDLFIVLHDKVSHACYTLNIIFSKQMLVLSFAVFFHATITIHFIVDQHLSLYLLCTDYIMVMRVCIACVYLILGYSLVSTCRWTGIQVGPTI